MTNATVVAVLVPPGPVAVTLADVVPAAVGVPVICPVEAESVAHAGRPVAVNDVAGRFVELLRATVEEKAVPTVPVKDWPGVIIGVPAATATLTDFESIPAKPSIFTWNSCVPTAVGEPAITPVLEFNVAQLGKLVD